MKEHIKNTAIKNSNCIEHVFCNVLLCMDIDYSMLFADSWNIVYNESCTLPIRDRIDIYDENYKQLYANLNQCYGISVQKIPWDLYMTDFINLKELIDEHEYIGLCLRTHHCRWLISIESVEEYHYLLIKGIKKDGLACYDYHSLDLNLLRFDDLHKGAVCFLVFNRIDPVISGTEFIVRLKQRLRQRKDSGILYHNISMLVNEFNDAERLREELRISELIISPLLRKISYLGFGRSNFIYTLNTYLADAFDVSAEISQLEAISKKWLFINKLITKFYLSDNKSVLENIKNVLHGLAGEEQELLTRINKKLE